MTSPLPRVLLFTDAAVAMRQGRGVVETVARALVGLSDTPASVLVVLRDKHQSAAQVAELACALAPICHRHHVPLLVHGHIDVCINQRLAGVHLSAEHDPQVVRQQLNAAGLHHAWIGVSRHVTAAGLDGPVAGADYATLSPVWPPTSKPDDTRTALGLDGLAQAIACCAVPVFALGGVTPKRAAMARQAGAHGAAVLGGWQDGRCPARAVNALVSAIEER